MSVLGVERCWAVTREMLAARHRNLGPGLYLRGPEHPVGGTPWEELTPEQQAAEHAAVDRGWERRLDREARGRG